MQFIDSRDLVEWTVRVGENKTTGIYNATGPAKSLTIAEMLYGIKAITTAGAQFVWAPADFLTSQKIQGWRHMTVWINPAGDSAGFLRRSNAKAVAAGGISAQREADVIAAWSEEGVRRHAVGDDDRRK